MRLSLGAAFFYAQQRINFVQKRRSIAISMPSPDCSGNPLSFSQTREIGAESRNMLLKKN